MKKFRFRFFPVYVSAIEFNKKIKILTEFFPKQEQFSLTSQIIRASYSIILNIAEGSDRGTDKNFARFLNAAHASLNEVVACLDLSLDNRYIEKQAHSDSLNEAKSLANQLTAFRKSLLENPKK